MAENDPISIPQADAGMAGSETQRFTRPVLFTGNPPETSTAEPVADETVASGPLPAYSVVGRRASDNKLVLAQANTAADGDPSNAIQAVGVTTVTVLQGTTGGSVPIWRDGCYNPAALTWHESFEDDEAKRLAFEPGPSPIYIKKPLYEEGV